MTRLGLFAISLATLGCMKNDGGLSTAQARSAGDSLATGIEESAQGFGKVSDGTTADSTCVVTSGDAADPDLDNIPVSAKLTYNCTGTSLGYTSTLTGTMGVVDDKPAAAAWAFTGMSDLHWTFTGPGGGSIVRDWDGQITATQPTAIGPFGLARMLDVVTVFTGDRGNSVTVTEDNDWQVNFTPMVAWTPGGVIVTGTLAATGSWNFSVGNATAMATLSTPVTLTVDPACETRITAGTLAGAYVDAEGDEGTITVVWSGCGVHTVTRN